MPSVPWVESKGKTTSGQEETYYLCWWCLWYVPQLLLSSIIHRGHQMTLGELDRPALKETIHSWAFHSILTLHLL